MKGIINQLKKEFVEMVNSGNDEIYEGEKQLEKLKQIENDIKTSPYLRNILKRMDELQVEVNRLKKDSVGSDRTPPRLRDCEDNLHELRGVLLGKSI